MGKILLMGKFMLMAHGSWPSKAQGQEARGPHTGSPQVQRRHEQELAHEKELAHE